MTYKSMLKTIWLKARYSLKSYLLFLILTILFIVMYFISLFHMKTEDIVDTQNILMVMFLYVPIVINQAIQSMEYSKVYYLVPRTSEDRKRFIRFENLVKLVLSITASTVLFLLGVWIKPAIWKYLLAWYLITAIAFSFAAAVAGYSSYYNKKRKKRKFAFYMVGYVITMIVMFITLMSGMFFMKKSTVDHWLIFAAAVSVVSVIYHVYYLIRFKNVDASYENINSEEKRLMKRSSSCIS